METRDEVLAHLRAEYPDLDFRVDPEHGYIEFSFEDMAIHDPWSSECGRFRMEASYYGLDTRDAVLMWSFNAPIVEAIDLENEP